MSGLVSGTMPPQPDATRGPYAGVAPTEAAPAPAATHATPTDPKAIKKLEKTIHKDEKHEASALKKVEKSAHSNEKHEAKAAKAELKAKALVDKNLKKESKAAAKLAKYQGRHNESVLALNKAREALEHKSAEHRDLIAKRDATKQEADQARAAKAEHDRQRQTALSATTSGATA